MSAPAVPAPVRAHLEALESAGLVAIAATDPELEYLFRHALIQEAAYLSLLKKDRSGLHREVGESLERLLPDSREQLAGTLAHHFELAGEQEKAARYYLAAADRALATYANTEAEALYRTGLRLVEELAGSRKDPPPDLEPALAEGLGEVLVRKSDPAGARACFERALSHAAHDPERTLRLLLSISGTVLREYRYEEAREALDRAEAALGGRPAGEAEWWERQWMEIQLARMNQGYWENDLEAMGWAVAEVRPTMDRLGRAERRADFYGSLARWGFRRSRFRVDQEALGYARKAVEAAEETGDPVDIAWRRFSLGFAHLWRRELGQAEEHLVTARDAGERYGETGMLGRASVYLVALSRARGDVERVRAAIGPAIEAVRAARFPEYEVQLRAHGAWVAWRDGRLKEAGEEALMALEDFRALPMPYPFHWMAIWPLIGLAVTEGQLEEAVEYARALFPEPQQPPPRELATPTEQAIAAWDHGDRGAAAKEITRATQVAETLGYL